MAAEFGLVLDGPAIDLGGSSSLNVRVGGHVVRVHRSWVTADRLAAVHTVRRSLVAEGLPAVAPIGSTRWRGHLVEVEGFVEGEPMDSWERLLVGMALLGRLHTALASLGEVPPAARDAVVTNQIGVDEARSTALEAVAAIRAWPDAADGELAAASATESLARRLDDARSGAFDVLPRQLVHGDFWDNNVLFRDGTVVAILDFDFMAERHRIDDLALILNYARSGFDQDERASRMRALVDAYDATASPRLDPLERKALPLALARIVLSYTGHLLQRPDAASQREVLRAWAVDLPWSLAMLDEPYM